MAALWWNWGFTGDGLAGFEVFFRFASSVGPMFVMGKWLFFFFHIYGAGCFVTVGYRGWIWQAHLNLWLQWFEGGHSRFYALSVVLVVLMLVLGKWFSCYFHKTIEYFCLQSMGRPGLGLWRIDVESSRGSHCPSLRQAGLFCYLSDLVKLKMQVLYLQFWSFIWLFSVFNVCSGLQGEF